MLVNEGFIRILVIVFLEVISFDHSYANGRSCYAVHNETICYFQPNETYINMTWDDAWNVCKENNSTLPVIENRMIAEKLRKYLESKNSLPYEMWLAGREIRMNDWQWLSGKSFGLQSISKGNRFDTNAVITGFEVKPIYPNRTNHYICYNTDSKLCQNKSIIHWKDGCLFVNNDEELNLADARNRCLDEGGDLATFEEDESLNMLKQKNSSLLHTYRQYWIGLRLNWWIWNETDTSKEIRYSNWSKYEILQYKECLYVRLIDYKWNQDHCKTKKPFICQTVATTTKEPGTDGLDTRAPLIDPLTGIIIGAIAVVLVVIVTVVLVIIVKRTKNKRISHPTDEKLTVPHEMSTQQIQNTSVKSKTIEVDEMNNHYAEIARAADHENDDECIDEPQPGTVYAALEFDANKAIYEEPVISSQRKQEASVPAKVDALNGNDQRGSSAESPTQAAEGTIYANM